MSEYKIALCCLIVGKANSITDEYTTSVGRIAFGVMAGLPRECHAHSIAIDLTRTEFIGKVLANADV